MGAIEVRDGIMICTCQIDRCKHKWVARRVKEGQQPIVCPKCHSPYWYIDKKAEAKND